MNIIVNNKEYDLGALVITKVSSDEQEAIFRVEAGDKCIHVYTSYNTYLTKLKKLVVANPDGWKITKVIERADGTISGVEAIGPKNGLSLKAKDRNTTPLTDEEKEKRRAILTNARKRRL